MGQTLVIAEKPSVAGDIARALGGFKKDGDFWVSDAMIVGPLSDTCSKLRLRKSTT